MVPPAFFPTPDELFSGAGGIAAAIAIGAFIGQALSVLATTSEQRRYRHTALGGLAGLLTMIGLILLSVNGR
jgi:hypothetical protein